MRTDTIVLGAGIIGVCSALHLQARGRAVMLVDRGDPGAETSGGNAGLIERSSMVPYAFPRRLSTLLRYGLNRSSAVRYDPSHLLAMAPWLARYWWHSAPARLAAAADAMRPLVERSVIEHDMLACEAGMMDLLRARGWIEIFRSPAAQDRAARAAEGLRPYGLRYSPLDRQALAAAEPSLREAAIGGIHWHDPKTVIDPGALVRGYADLFVRRGGRFVKGEVRSLSQAGSGWAAETAAETLTAREAVVALGPWTSPVLRPLGYRLPMAIKRGYHMHYRDRASTVLHHSIVDEEGGYVLAPMARGIRLATGIEFAAPGAPPNEHQLRRAEKLARTIVPLGERLDRLPWLGLRPCFPDMKPVIGPAPRHRHLWLAFGHAHHGLTLGPVTGRLLAELITGEPPFTDPAPYGAARFGQR